MAGNYIKYNILRVLKANLEETVKFYTSKCGMLYNVKSVSKESYPYRWEDTNLHIFSFDGSKKSPTGLCFIVDNFPSVDCRDRGYWKVGFGLRDVNAAVTHLKESGCQATPGEQFIDVGFLTHVSDPNGYCIELLQHDFEKNFVAPSCQLNVLKQPADIPPTVGQITIRCTDEPKTIDFYTKVLGMKLVCIEPIKSGSFVCTLYFFAYTDEEPPNAADLTSVENREWLYRKQFCQIEIQHQPNRPKDSKYFTNDKNEDGVKLGHVGFCLHVTPSQLATVKSNVSDYDVKTDEDGKEKLFVHDPDGYLIELHA